MKYKVEKSSHFGTTMLLIELIGTVIYLNGLTMLLDIKIHGAIRLVISIAVAIGIIKIFISSIMGRKIIVVIYSILWVKLGIKIIGSITNNDIIWIILIGVAIFIISVGIHQSIMNENGGDYTITKIDD